MIKFQLFARFYVLERLRETAFGIEKCWRPMYVQRNMYQTANNEQNEMTVDWVGRTGCIVLCMVK